MLDQSYFHTAQFSSIEHKKNGLSIITFFLVEIDKNFLLAHIET